jgi:hypothetical protein
MRNEIWSLISFIGAPSWFITLSPADSKHPICLYFADNDEEFKPDIRMPDEAYRLVSQNPVAAARFFHFVCETFIVHVLGVDNRHAGLFGKTSAYYGTVEQQGRLTLHMHLLLWISQSLSPQEVRDRILDHTSDFQRKMVEYIEAVHMGQFFNGSLSDVKSLVKHAADNVPGYVDPTKTMPLPPPKRCRQKNCSECSKCSRLLGWWDKFKKTVDDLVFRSNVHSCKSSAKDKQGNYTMKGCVNSEGQCKARFPREVVAQTAVDHLSGSLKIKKGEPWLNTFNPVITYLLRCNTDVTSLLSGTAIKAVVGYVTDYVTKPGLNTYSIFDTVRQSFERNTDMLNSSTDRKQAARILMTKIVNGLTAKMEIGSPMASLYLLQNPDHYASHEFVNFYWKSYVREARMAWLEDSEIDKSEKGKIDINMGKYICLSGVNDYICRPRMYEHTNLYEWIQTSKKTKRNKKEMKEFHEQQERRRKKSYNELDIATDNEDELDLFACHTDNSVSNTGGGQNTPDVNTLYDMADDDTFIEDNFTEEEDMDKSDVDLNISDMNEILEEECSQYEFLATHPQYNTHQIRCNEDATDIIPNFIGGTLPRCDHGDREYYCSTMLTLFKPWRSGKDLKFEGRTWDEQFLSHKFSPHQLDLMKNFNLRYECNDARDDYYAKRRQGNQKSKLFASWATDDMLESLDDDLVQTHDESMEYELDESAYLYNSMFSENNSKIQQMNEIETVVKNAGWLDKSQHKLDLSDFKEFKPSKNIDGSKWNSIVQAAKQTVLEEKKRNMPSTVPSNKCVHEELHKYNEVKIADISYLRQSFHAEQAEQQNFIDSTVIEYCLNIEQERAFRIVANHATANNQKQLKMYLGGMGGTGKSQVIKALVCFFNKRQESHRIMILAPTGTAAALLNGSTYHSALGVPIDGVNGTKNDFVSLAHVRTRLDGVDYIFVDEISMVSCHELYKISAQLAKARNVVDMPFGGLNMIFAGDFAQLKPVRGSALYSSLVGTSIDASKTLQGQQSAIGKALWHQVTTVVILRQNMRQNKQTEDDSKLRTALENMRYACCTPEDISFLRTRIAGRRKNQPDLTAPQFRNVSIITALNSHKDRLNQLGCERFASETNQELTHFYSIDVMGNETDPAVQKSGRRNRRKSASQCKIGPALENMLWNLRHAASDHIPGKLSLCVGMPVMIRHNSATELCITRGQEGHVAGWQSTKGPSGQNVLDTIFVKLDNPAQNVHLEGLSDNVVPLTKIAKTITCLCPSDLKLSVSRSQVHVLPNFSMTDYAAQGKTRPFNIVDLNNCRDHTSYYTCLSRSATSEGTALIQGFDSSKITKGAPGYLRQEFREYEILDDITKQLYEGTLPTFINGHLRNSLI